MKQRKPVLTCQHEECQETLGPVGLRRGVDGLCRACGLGVCDRHHPCSTLDDRDFRLASFLYTIKQRAALFWKSGVRDLPLAEAALALNPSATSCLVRTAESDDDLGSKDWPWGGYHIHVPVTFDTGEQWLARFPWPVEAHGPPWITEQGEVNILCAEFAALQALNGVVPGLVPKAWMPPDQTRYFFTELIDGQQYAKHEEHPSALRGIAAFVAQLTTMSFTGIGGLYASADSSLALAVGPLQDRRGWTKVHPGPHACLRDAYLAAIEGCIAHVTDRVAKSWERRTAELAYLGLLELRALIEQCAEFSDEKTYVLHADFHDRNILVSPDGNLRGVIDWECAHTAPLAAVALPTALWNAKISPSSTMLQLRDEYLALGRSDLADAVQHSPKFLAVGQVFRTDYDGMANTLSKLKNINVIRGIFLGKESKCTSLDEWVAVAREKHGADEGFRQLEAALEERDRLQAAEEEAERRKEEAAERAAERWREKRATRRAKKQAGGDGD